MRITEDTVMSEVRQENPDALNWLIKTYTHMVYGLAHRMLRGTCNPEDIEECVSDVFVDAWNRASDYDSDRGTVKTWLLILTKFKALEYRRRFNRRTALPLHENLDAVHSTVEDTILAQERARVILKAVLSLPPPDRDIICRRYIHYQSIEEIAQTLGLTRQAVDNRLWRIRKSLKQQLNGAQIEEG